VVVDNHRSNDFSQLRVQVGRLRQDLDAIAGDLPADRVARTIREDTRNPQLLYLGTEIGLFVSVNGGQNWVELKNNMPTMPFNDLTSRRVTTTSCSPRTRAASGFSTTLNALQGLAAAAAVRRAALHHRAGRADSLHQPEGAHRRHDLPRRESAERRHHRLLAVERAGAGALTVHDAGGHELVQTLTPTSARGVNRVVWNLRHAELPVRGGGGGDDDEGRAAAWRGRTCAGHLHVRLVVGGKTLEQKVEVKDDPRIDATPADRKIWSDFQMQTAAAIRQFAPLPAAGSRQARRVRADVGRGAWGVRFARA
jgi:hypothetical protein